MGAGPLILLEHKPKQTAPTFGEQQSSIKEEVSEMEQMELPFTSIQACTIEALPQTNNSKLDVCNHSGLLISIKNKTYSLPDYKTNQLKIVGGYQKTAVDIKCNAVGVVGPCKSHQLKVFDCSAFKDDLLSSPTNSLLSFKAKSVPFYKIFDNGTLFPWDAKKSVYKVAANTCGQKASKEIVVYPDVEIEIDIPFEMSEEVEEKKNYSQTGQSAWKNSEEKEELKLSASYKEDGSELKVSADIQRKFKEVKELIKLGKRITSTVQKAFDESIKVETKLPSGKIHLDFAWKEFGNFDVDSQWSAIVQLTPLCGVSYTVELDEIVLKAMSGPVGILYTKVKKALEKYKTTVCFQFIASGEINLDMGLKKDVGKEAVKSGAGLSGKIELQLKGAGSFKIQKIIYAEAAAEGGAKSSIKGQSFIYAGNSCINMDLKVEFTGVKFYFEVKITGASERKSKNKKQEDTVSQKNEYTLASYEYVVGAPEEPWIDTTFNW